MDFRMGNSLEATLLDRLKMLRGEYELRSREA
jgi:hypothetical protein